MPADVQAGGWSSSKNSSAVSVTISAGSVILVERRDLDDVVHVDAVQLDDLADPAERVPGLARRVSRRGDVALGVGGETSPATPTSNRPSALRVPP